MKKDATAYILYFAAFLTVVIYACFAYSCADFLIDELTKGKRVRLTIVGIPIEKEEKDDGLSESAMDTE
jgi:hypothetical protein